MTILMHLNMKDLCRKYELLSNMRQCWKRSLDSEEEDRQQGHPPRRRAADRQAHSLSRV